MNSCATLCIPQVAAQATPALPLSSRPYQLCRSPAWRRNAANFVRPSCSPAMTAARFPTCSARALYSTRAPVGVLILACTLLSWLSFVLFVYPDPPQVAQQTAQQVLRSSLAAPKVLIVVISIPHSYHALARQSHVSYAARHGYDFREVSTYLGSYTRGHNRRAVSMQKLLACTLAEDHDYVLVLDSDVVIGPWTPPIHVAARALGDKIGIVDENQPRRSTDMKIKRLRAALDRGVPVEQIGPRTANGYYRAFGFHIEAPGILNTGVMLFQPKHHGIFLEKLYYDHVEMQMTSPGGFHYEQSMFGNEITTRNMYRTLPHAWNRIWVWYNWSSTVGEPAYTLPDVFQRSYFLHFCWAKGDMQKLDKWRKEKNISFAPAPYATDVLP